MQKIKSTLLVFEVGSTTPKYDAVFVYGDGKNKRMQVTLSFGLTEDSGNLSKLLSVYATLNGSYAPLFAPYLPKIGVGVLASSNAFKELLKEAARNDPFFCLCQDVCFDALYLSKGREKANEYGIKTALGLLVITDSVLHGSLDLVAKSFRAARPSRGGDEKIFIAQYVNARKKWLESQGKPLNLSIYRMDTFLDAIEKGNWDLSKPLNANGIIID